MAIYKIEDKALNIDIEALLDKIRIELQRRGLNKLKYTKKTIDNIMIQCPKHKGGNESKPSCGVLLVNKDDAQVGTVHCFTCGYQASLEQLISDLFEAKDDGEFGRAWLLSHYDIEDEYENRSNIKIEDRYSYKEIKKEFISEEELAKYRFYHPYMFQRKLTKEVIDKFDVGYDKERRCITFPVADKDGNVVFIARRSVDTKFFNYPSGVDKPVYGLQFIDPKKPVYVCESFFNCLTLETWGYQAIALMGTGSVNQYKILKSSGIREYIMCFDGDGAGDRGASKFRENLGKIAFIKQKWMPDHKDVNDLSQEEFENLEIF